MVFVIYKGGIKESLAYLVCFVFSLSVLLCLHIWVLINASEFILALSYDPLYRCAKVINRVDLEVD